MICYIDEYREAYGVEPICKVLPIAPSIYYERKAVEFDPDRESNRSSHDRHLEPEIERIWKENFEGYGVRKGWRQMKPEHFVIARCTVERLMRKLGLRSVTRGPRSY